MQKRRHQLESTLATIERRWGNGAIYRIGQQGSAQAYPALSLGCPRLEAALGIGGMPRGQISELMGQGTAGHATLAANALRHAQQAGQQTVYIDMSRSIDLDHLAHCGVELHALIILRPGDAGEALESACELARGGGTGVMVVDDANDLVDPPGYSIRRVSATLRASSWTLLLLAEYGPAYGRQSALSPWAAVRLLCEHQAWLYAGPRVVGYRSRVTILKNRLGSPGQSVSITFPIIHEANCNEDDDTAKEATTGGMFLGPSFHDANRRGIPGFRPG